MTHASGFLQYRTRTTRDDFLKLDPFRFSRFVVKHGKRIRFDFTIASAVIYKNYSKNIVRSA